jgi:uncharacterized protein YhbP (UPF0306 family)
MADPADSAWVRALIGRNSTIVLSTTDGDKPWVAPVEYLVDDDLNFYFFSPDESRHVRHLEANSSVAAVVFDRDQPEYTAETTADLNGVQMECSAARVAPEDYNDAIDAAIEALNLAMPPYAVFKVVPHRFFVPRIERGLNVRYEVDMS